MLTHMFVVEWGLRLDIRFLRLMAAATRIQFLTSLKSRHITRAVGNSFMGGVGGKNEPRDWEILILELGQRKYEQEQLGGEGG